MVRQVLAASGALIAAVALPSAPSAAADDGQLVQIAGGAVQCLVSADDVPRGGGPMVVCERVDGQAYGIAPYATGKYNETLPAVVMRGTGQFNFAKGSLGVPPGQGVTVGAGQTYNVNGWTIQPDEHRTRFTYDATGHGLLINAENARSF
jgi:Ca-activated chloride channel family protein